MLLDAVSIANKARVPLECPQVSSHESLAFVRLAVANFRFVRSGRRVLYLVGISAAGVTRAALMPTAAWGANANPRAATQIENPHGKRFLQRTLHRATQTSPNRIFFFPFYGIPPRVL